MNTFYVYDIMEQKGYNDCVVKKEKQEVQYKILIVEDDRVIAGELKKYLFAWGYVIETVSDFNNIVKEFVNFSPHLVLMDISLPFYNGYYWCAEIRNLSKIPIIFVSSANDNMNIVMAINMGGDDFVSKPFDLAVLSAKIQAMLRRTYSFQNNTTLLECKGVILDLSKGMLEAHGEKIELTKNEFRMLQLLFENKGNSVTREAIMQHLWDGDCFVDDNTLAVNMTRLRKKLDDVGLQDFITTKKGIGYLLED